MTLFEISILVAAVVLLLAAALRLWQVLRSVDSDELGEPTNDTVVLVDGRCGSALGNWHWPEVTGRAESGPTRVDIPADQAFVDEVGWVAQVGIADGWKPVRLTVRDGDFLGSYDEWLESRVPTRTDIDGTADYKGWYDRAFAPGVVVKVGKRPG